MSKSSTMQQSVHVARAIQTLMDTRANLKTKESQMSEPSPSPMNSTSQMSLSELVAALGEARAASSSLYNTYKETKAVEDQLRYELEMVLKSSGLKSAKGADFQATITETPRVVVKSEQDVIEWLQHAPDIESDRYIGLKTTEFQSLAKSLLKGTGEVIPGTEVEVHESLAIRANKQAKKVQG